MDVVFNDGEVVFGDGEVLIADDPCDCCGGEEYECGCCPETMTLTTSGNVNHTGDCSECGETDPPSFIVPCGTLNNQTSVMDLVSCDSTPPTTSASFAGPPDPACSPPTLFSTGSASMDCDTGDYSITANHACEQGGVCCGGGHFSTGNGTSICSISGNSEISTPTGYSWYCPDLGDCTNDGIGSSPSCTNSVTISGPAP